MTKDRGDMPDAEALRVLMTGIVFGEQPRWHDGRLWFSDWGRREVIALDLAGKSEVVLRAPSFPCCVGWLPDGSQLVVAGQDGELLRHDPTGALIVHAELSTASSPPVGNELVVDGRGNAYVNGGGFNLAKGEPFAPGVVVLVTPDGAARVVARDLAFPNGMLIMPDEVTLVVGESYAKRLTAFDIAPNGTLSGRRVWADLADGVPDGLCCDVEGAIWYGDVPNRRCVRVREGGEILQVINLDRGCFACALGGSDRRTLFMITKVWEGAARMFEEPPTGQVLAMRAPAPGAGRP